MPSNAINKNPRSANKNPRVSGTSRASLRHRPVLFPVLLVLLVLLVWGTLSACNSGSAPSQSSSSQSDSSQSSTSQSDSSQSDTSQSDPSQSDPSQTDPSQSDPSQSAPFQYEHDPRLNPRAMQDIMVDPEAVYGFSPSPDGGLAEFIKYDWTDADAVAGYQQMRRDYFASYAQMYELLDEMIDAGNSVEEMARAVSAKRNEIRMAAYKDDPEGLATMKERNLQEYGHEEGPAPDDLFAKYGSWETVLEKAFSHNPGMDACVGLYDEYYEYYIAFGYVDDDDGPSDGGTFDDGGGQLDDDWLEEAA